MKLVLLIILLLPLGTFAGSSYTIKFTVIDDVSETPINGAKIELGEEESFTLSTDENGFVSSKDSKEEWIVAKVTADGYYDQYVYGYSRKAKEDVSQMVRMVPTNRPNISVKRLANLQRNNAAYKAVWESEMHKRQEAMKDLDTNVVPPCSFGSDEFEDSDSELYFDPEFPGGPSALHRYIVENIDYPEYAIHNDEQGKVYLSFDIAKDGVISNVKIVRGLSPALDAEALFVLQTMPRWVPGYCNGRPLKIISYKLPIVFTLD